MRVPVNRLKRSPWLWLERLIAIAALANLSLVVFDASYIRFRDTYLRLAPQITVWYGANYKGIEPERFTQKYLQLVSTVAGQIPQTGLHSPQVEALLTQLQVLSTEMIDENPFQLAHKSGTLERIKNRLRERLHNDSAKQAFRQFWSSTYLEQVGWANALGYFDRQIQPLMATNYFRHIGEDGDPIDRFWRIDLCFIALFGLDFGIRCWFFYRRDRDWLNAILWRWFDLPLLIPFSLLPALGWLSFLRIVPVAIRLDQAQLIDLGPIGQRLNRLFVNHLAVELTEAVILRVIAQIQTWIKTDQISAWLLSTQSEQRKLDTNGIDEVSEMTTKLAFILVDQVLPQIQPELVALLHHSTLNAIEHSGLKRSLRFIPGAEALSNRLTQHFLDDFCQSLFVAIQSALHDPVGTALAQKLVDRFGATFQSELQQGQNLAELQSLLIALLEEVKINYVTESSGHSTRPNREA